MTDEIVTFLLEPDRLKLAVELVAKMEDVRERVLDTYWQNVRAGLDSRFVERTGRWEAFGPSRVLDAYSAIGIAPRSDRSGREDDRSLSGYRVVYECLAGTKHPAYLGVQCSGQIGTDAALQPCEQEIKNRLEQLGLKRREEHWLGWQYINELGLPAITAGDLAVLLVLNDDNRNVDHPLADHAAQVLWDVFSSTRELLEKAMEILSR
jgi:hypothetical protein